MPLAPQQQIQVLHVDDEPEFTDLTATFLKRESDRFAVETATSADEGLKIINDRPIDCVVSDYDMPGMDGLEFLRTVREANPDLPFVLYTGKGSETVAGDAIAADVTDYLQKGSGTEQYELLANRIHNAVQARRDAERATRQEQLMRLTEFAGDTGGFELDKEGDTILLTAGTRRIIGRPNHPEISVEKAIELFHPDDREEIKQTLSRAFETGEEMHERWRLQPGDGDERLLELTFTPVVENGEVTKLRGAGHDVTDREKRRSELDQIRDLTANMEELAGVGAWEYDPNTDEPTNTAGAKRIYGVDPEVDLSLDEAFEFYDQEDRKRLKTRFWDCLERGEPYEIDVRLTTADGEQRWVTARGERVQTNQQQPVVRGYIQDVTEEKRRERQLTELNRAMQDLLTAETRQEVADIGVTAARDILDLQANAIYLSAADDTRLVPAVQTDQLTSLAGDAPTLPVADSIAGRVYQHGEPTVIDDVRQDKDVHDRETDLRGHVYFPLADHGILIGGAKERAAFDRNDVALGKLVAGNLVATLDRIEREQAVHEQRQKLSLFFQDSPIGGVQWDENFNFDRLNERAEEILGYSESELRGKPWDVIVTDEDHDHVGDVVEQLLADEGGTQTINRNVRKNGETRTCKWHNRAVTDAEGDVRAIFSKFEDITQQEERRRELQKVKSQYQTLVENFPNGAVFLYDTDFRVVRAGGSALSDTGLSAREIEGTTPHSRYPPEISEEVVQSIEKAFNGDSHILEQEYDGEQYRVQMTPVRPGGQEITQVMAVSENVTERTEQRRELKRQNKRLEEFASIVSHDLRSPLIVATSNIELAQETCESDRLDQATEAIDRSRGLIDDLLTLAREGETVDDFERVSLTDVARTSWDMVDTADVALTIDAERTIYADQSRLQQLFENLYRNAVDHGGDDVTVSVGAVDGGFYVADTGPGIPEADREAVFDMGYSTAEDGTGVGLQVVEQVADAHGWDATVTESEQGGARFEVTGAEFADR